MNGRVKVIKLGGSLLEDASRRAVVLRGIAASWKHGERIVLMERVPEFASRSADRTSEESAVREIAEYIHEL